MPTHRNGPVSSNVRPHTNQSPTLALRSNYLTSLTKKDIKNMNPNEIQKKVIVGIAAVVFAMMLYPPFRIYGYGSNSAAIQETGYAWIFSLPDRATVDVILLFVQWIGVLIIGSLAMVLLKDRSPA